jgi:hypothetical protein
VADFAHVVAIFDLFDVLLPFFSGGTCMLPVKKKIQERNPNMTDKMSYPR